jgi:hypothetical protein
VRNHVQSRPVKIEDCDGGRNKNEECMGRFRRVGFCQAVAIISLAGISGCGGHKPPGVSPYPTHVTLTPGNSTSVQLGAIFSFIASAQNGNGSNVSVTFTYQSSDTTILNLAPNGVACAGHWDAAYAICTPGTTGVALVTASALGATSAPTFVFVHPLVDTVTVNGVLLNGIPIQEPCLPQGDSMTIEAHAYSQGTDVTASVGPFTWSANNINVVKIVPLPNNIIINGTTYNMATNLATVTAAIPGFTQIFGTASGVVSTSFQQPQYQNAQGVTSPLLDFFETCPVQNIALGVGATGSQQTTQTSFVTAKGTGEPVSAIVTDVMGNSTLPSTNGGVQLSKIPLTWTQSSPTVVAVPSTCQESCSLTTPSPGAASITASCSPPTCNIGFPQVPQSLSTPSGLAACAQFFQLASCQQFIPLPVYATIAVSGTITGAASADSALATSVGCASMNPIDCTTAMYNISTSKTEAGNATALPFSPNSILFDLAGDKAFIGSELGAVSITPTNIGSANSPFSSLGTVTGKILAVSSNALQSVFSDTQLNPNQVFIVSTVAANAPSVTAFNINNASTAGFSSDGLKGYIYGFDANGNPDLYIYSTLQALQTIPLAAGTTINSIVPSANGAFTYVVEPSLAGGGPAFTVFNTCNNQISTDTVGNQQIIPLSAPPVAFNVLPDGVHFVALEDNGTFDYITATVTGIPAATIANPASSLCPMQVSHTVQNFNLNQGAMHPINIFTSADETLFYVLASDRASVLVYNFATGAVNGILLANNATPLSAFMTADASTIMIAASDGMLHEVTTGLGGYDAVQLSFPNLPSLLNPFCTNPGPNGPCTFDLLAVKP